MKHSTVRRAVAGGVATTVALAVAAPAVADQPIDSSALRAAVTVGGITDHLLALQDIAVFNDDNRASGTPGYEESAEYVAGMLEAAGYTVTTQPFSYERFTVDVATIDSPSPAVPDLTYGEDFFELEYSPEGSATATVQAVDVNLAGDRASTSGCEAADFGSFVAGNIALIQRGTCPFRTKAENAATAGASAVLIFNQGNVDPSDDRFGLFFGTLDPDPAIAVPAFSLPFQLGADLVALAAAPGGLQLSVDLQTTSETVNTFNVLADSKTGRADRTVLVGAHLDSVPEGPGINDNGSGSATILEVAEQMSALGIQPRNRVRFAFWGGEEDGLIGSSYYVSQLTARQRKDHALNLNFDMVGSPNFGRFIYDGDGSAFGTKGPNGSGNIESVFASYFASQGLATAPTAFDGRSDYFGFIEAGIPAGGLFTGAEDIKTPAEFQLFGGTPGVAFDPCYHSACDTINNVSTIALDQMSDAVAHSVLTFAMTSAAVSGTSRGNATGGVDLAFRGDRALR